MLEWCVLELEWRRRVVWSASGWHRGGVGMLECWSAGASVGVALVCSVWGAVGMVFGVVSECC